MSVHLIEFVAGSVHFSLAAHRLFSRFLLHGTYGTRRTRYILVLLHIGGARTGR